MSDVTEVYSPPSSEEPPPLPEMVKKSWNGWWTLLWGVGVMIAWLVVQGIIMTIAYYLQGPSPDPRIAMEALQYDGDVLGIITLISAALICPLCYLIGHLKKGWNGWEYLGFKKVGWLKILFWIGITFLMGLAFNFLAPYLGADATPEFMKRVATSSQYPMLHILGGTGCSLYRGVYVPRVVVPWLARFGDGTVADHCADIDHLDLTSYPI